MNPTRFMSLYTNVKESVSSYSTIAYDSHFKIEQFPPRNPAFPTWLASGKISPRSVVPFAPIFQKERA